ncbi:MAG: FHA domain-containing protein [Gemmataceae bacterium]|nr:FHA domain-containing protein [Gemmataceae bacterium]
MSRPSFLVKSDNPKEIGQLGGYGILKILGRGGMGMVFLAHERMLDRLVAVKVMLPEVVTPDNRDRFFREARSTAALHDDHVVPIFQVGEENGVPYLVMPFLQGEPLDRRLARERKPPLRETLRIIREAAIGLMAAHNKGMIHRDIKPGNIWLEGARGRVRLLDFGLALTRSTDVRITQVGAIMGTPAYIAPEQASGQEVDCRADLFSLGVVFYEMLTGVRPFLGNDTLAILTALLTTTPTSPSALDPSIPHQVSQLAMSMIARDPAHRAKSAREVAMELTQWERATPLKQSTAPPVQGNPPSLVNLTPNPTPMQVERIFDTKMIFEAIPEEILKQLPGAIPASAPTAPVMITLQLLAPNTPPNLVRGEKIQVGRGVGSKLRIQSTQVSRLHAQILWQWLDGGYYAIQDLGSSNGTFVNQQAINQVVPLLPGDQLNFGTLGFRINYSIKPDTLIAARHIQSGLLGDGHASKEDADQPIMAILVEEDVPPKPKPPDNRPRKRP